MRRLALLLLAGTAHARPIHGSIGAGGALLFTGEQGDRFRGEVAADLKWHSRYGGILAWRAFDKDRNGLLTGGLVYEAAAARPRLVIDLVAEAGWDLDQKRPLVGAGIRSTLTIIGPLGVSFHTGAYFVIDDLDGSRLQIQSDALVVARW